MNYLIQPRHSTSYSFAQIVRGKVNKWGSQMLIGVWVHSQTPPLHNFKINLCERWWAVISNCERSWASIASCFLASVWIYHLVQFKLNFISIRSFYLLRQVPFAFTGLATLVILLMFVPPNRLTSIALAINHSAPLTTCVTRRVTVHQNSQRSITTLASALLALAVY